MRARYLSRLDAMWRHSLRDKGCKFPWKQCFVEGHRGGMHLEPENTVRSFKNGIELGCDSVELDVSVIVMQE
jgi:glycerophosphoryl diester phosphodiesterase